MNIQEVRSKFPQYNDLSDEQLVSALHRRYYSDMSYDDFAKSAGLSVKKETPVTASGVAAEGGKGLLRGASDAALLIPRGIAAAAGPAIGPLIRSATEGLVAPSRELVAADPQNTMEQMASTGGEIVGAGAAGGGLGSVRAALLTGASAGGGVVGEQIAGEPGRVVGTLAAPVASLAKPAIEAGAKSLMQSALKPTLKDLSSGKAARAVETMLEEGLNPTNAGNAELRRKIAELKREVSEVIQNSPATVNKQAVGQELQGTLDKFSKQVSARSDLDAIRKTWDDFVNHPLLKGDDIPVQLAQEMKQGTYKVLEKKYGQQGTAEVEAQKAIARGLRKEIEKEVPEVIGLNARESKLIDTLKVSERRALMDLNKNPMGLTLLAENPAAALGFMADKSALFKSLLARMMYGSQKVLVDPSVAARIGAVEGAPNGQ